MKIAQVSPLFERVPPKGYGGTERVISYLTEELVRLGHDVTLFASGDSITAAQLESTIAQSLRYDFKSMDWLIYHTIQLDKVLAMAHVFDVIHFHTDYLHFPLTRALNVPHLTTVHGRLDLPELVPLYKHFNDIPLVSISNNQRTPLPHVNWRGTVYHGLPSDLYPFQAEAEDYFVFIGRISPEKRVDRAIEIALQCEMPLYIAAKIDRVDELYFNECIKPLFNHPLVKFIGEIGEQDKRGLLGRARALLFPIDWPEPFGLVLIESFACGTPVIAYSHGSVPEIMEEGITGFVVNNQEQAIRAARDIGLIDRKRCREVFERRFTATHMAENYLKIYQNTSCR
jgi:glycosyltransferase involved in cell wall biosynthesis